MLNQATITAVHNGIESTHEVEDADLATFYAVVVGVTQGVIKSGGVVTNIVTSSD